VASMRQLWLYLVGRLMRVKRVRRRACVQMLTVAAIECRFDAILWPCEQELVKLSRTCSLGADSG